MGISIYPYFVAFLDQITATIQRLPKFLMILSIKPGTAVCKVMTLPLRYSSGQVII